MIIASLIVAAAAAAGVKIVRYGESCFLPYVARP